MSIRFLNSRNYMLGFVATFFSFSPAFAGNNSDAALSSIQMAITTPIDDMFNTGEFVNDCTMRVKTDNGVFIIDFSRIDAEKSRINDSFDEMNIFSKIDGAIKSEGGDSINSLKLDAAPIFLATEEQENTMRELFDKSMIILNDYCK